MSMPDLLQKEHSPLSRMDLFAHLPFSVLRTHQTSDSRQLASGKSLRRSVEIPYIKSLGDSPTSADPVGWIYETQVSIHISLVDQDCWTAYVFEDTYFKSDKEAGTFSESLQEASYYCLDALAGARGSGIPDSTNSTDPLEYFLRLCEARIEKAHIAWATIVEELEKVVKE